MKRALLVGSIVVAALVAEPVVLTVSAQEAGATSDKASARKARAKRAKKKKKAAETKAEEAKAEDAKPAAETIEVAVPGGQSAPAGDKATASSALSAAGEDIRKEGDTEVKTMELSGLDIEGQLKTPQLLYFLTRLRAEFDRPRLPHRSFMPELSRSSGEKALR
jgi:hypothetical protein